MDLRLQRHISRLCGQTACGKEDEKRYRPMHVGDLTRIRLENPAFKDGVFPSITVRLVHLAECWAGGGGRNVSPPGMRFRSQRSAVPSLLVVVKFVPLGENSTDHN